MTKLDERPFKIPFTKKCELRSVHPFVSKIPARSVHRSQKMNGVRERRSFERRSLTLCLEYKPAPHIKRIGGVRLSKEQPEFHF